MEFHVILLNGKHWTNYSEFKFVQLVHIILKAFFTLQHSGENND